MASCSQHMSSEFVLLEQFLILGTLILSLWHRSLKSCNVWSILSIANTLPCNDCSWMRILALAFKRDLRTTEGAKLSRPAKKNKDIVVVVVTKGLSHLLCLHATLNLTFYLYEKALLNNKIVRGTRSKKILFFDNGNFWDSRKWHAGSRFDYDKKICVSCHICILPRQDDDDDKDVQSWTRVI